MSKRKLDNSQLELELSVVEDAPELATHRLPTAYSYASVYDFKPKMLVAQALARKARAEKVLRAAGLIG
jgi:hypothetical protein